MVMLSCKNAMRFFSCVCVSLYFITAMTFPFITRTSSSQCSRGLCTPFSSFFRRRLFCYSVRMQQDFSCEYVWSYICCIAWHDGPLNKRTTMITLLPSPQSFSQLLFVWTIMVLWVFCYLTLSDTGYLYLFLCSSSLWSLCNRISTSVFIPHLPAQHWWLFTPRSQ